MLLDGVFATLGAAGLGGQDAKDAVGVTHGRDFRVGGDDRFVGKIERHQCARLDPCRGVADDVIELHLRQLIQDLLDPLTGEGIFVPGLGGGQDKQIFRAFVLDQRLIEVCFPVDDVDEVIHHAPLAAHDEIQVSQTDVKVNDHCLVTTLG